MGYTSAREASQEEQPSLLMHLISLDTTHRGFNHIHIVRIVSHNYYSVCVTTLLLL